MKREIAAGFFILAAIIYVFVQAEKAGMRIMGVLNGKSTEVETANNPAADGLSRRGRYADEEEALFSFIQKHLLGKDGEILTNLKDAGDRAETLSESVGLLMNYCVLRDMKGLFEKEYAYLKNHLMVDGKYIKWRVSKQRADCNSAIDDLRIVRALLDAYEKWREKEYLDTAGFVQNAMYEKQTVEGCLAEFYDWKHDAVRMSIPLCYIDLYTIYRLGVFNKNWKTTAEKGFRIINNGRIEGEGNPFFYKYYDYKTRSYSLDEEAAKNKSVCLTYTLLTAMHLVEYNQDTGQFTAWLKREIGNGRLYGWYNPETLKPASDIESTAIYALAAVYSKKVGEKELNEKLINRMLDFMVTDRKSPYYGGFGNTQTMEFYSFDNLTALWALAEANEYL